MKTVDVKNNLIINNLIKKHWGLSKKSQNLFTHRLLYERDIPKEFASLLGDDLRYRVPLSFDMMDGLDISWSKFKNEFSTYVENRGVTYENYINNKITVGKNTFKLVKDIINFYKENINIFLQKEPVPPRKDVNDYYLYYYLYLIEQTIPVIVNKIKDSFYALNEDLYRDESIKSIGVLMNGNELSRSSYIRSIENIFIDTKNFFGSDDIINCDVVINYTNKNFQGRVNTSLLFTKDKLEEISKSIREDFSKRIEVFYRRKFEEIVRTRLFNDTNYELVISLNYADWLLASTGDSWSSCISLYSTYDECYWTGLAQLIGDKSRAMVYITKKGDKKRYRGVEVDKFYVRTWVQLWRTVKKGELDNKVFNRTFFDAVRTYPVDMEKKALTEILESILNLDSHETIKNMFFNESIPSSYFSARSRYYSENFWFRSNMNGLEFLTTIYLDGGDYKIAKKNKAKYFVGEYGYYKFNGSGSHQNVFERASGRPSSVSLTDDSFLASGISFDELIDEGRDVIDEFNNFIKNGYMRNQDEEDWDEEEYEEEYEDEEEYEEAY